MKLLSLTIALGMCLITLSNAMENPTDLLTPETEKYILTHDYKWESAYHGITKITEIYSNNKSSFQLDKTIDTKIPQETWTFKFPCETVTAPTKEEGNALLVALLLVGRTSDAERAQIGVYSINDGVNKQ
jgi:hypothetical protein